MKKDAKKQQDRSSKSLKRIILLGYMASGKSFIGKRLAKKIELPFIDLDDYIEKKEELSVSQLFSKKGEDYFRQKEFFYLKEILALNDSFVLSLGGGTPLLKDAMQLINKEGQSFYLEASVQTLFERLQPNEVERPILNEIDKDFLRSYIDLHLAQRIPFYKLADKTISIDGLDVNEIVELIKLITNTINV